MSGVQSVERAMAILRAVGSDPGGLVAIAGRTGLPTSTTARILATLEREGGLRRDREGVYRIGPDIISMAGPTTSSDVATSARLHMVALADELGEAVALSIPSGATTTTVMQIDGPKPVRAEDWTGTVVPLHAGCVGLVTLAFLEPSDIAAYLHGELDIFTGDTVIDPSTIRARLEMLRRGEPLWTHGEYVEGISSVAAPIFDERGRPVASLYAYGPSYRFPESEASSPRSAIRAPAHVASTAEKISIELGWVPSGHQHTSSTHRGDA